MASYDSLGTIGFLVSASESRIRRRFADVVLQIQRERTLAELAELIVAGRFDDALDVLSAAAARLASSVTLTFSASGERVLDELAEALGIVVSFDGTNPVAVSKMTNARLEVIRSFTRQQREATRLALADGLRRGLNPIAQARNFRDSIGLTPLQEKWVQNYRRELEALDSRALGRKLRDKRFDRTVRRAIAAESGLPRAQIDKMVGRYRDRWRKFRAETIARTESLSAVHEGVDEAFRQSLATGSIRPEQVERTWNTADDERVRDFDDGPTSHASMHGQIRKPNEPFTSGAGNELRFPGDPSAPPYDRIKCRCRVGTRVTS